MSNPDDSLTEWQPPETAPKDGIVFLADMGYGFAEATSWRSNDGKWIVSRMHRARMSPEEGGGYDSWFQTDSEDESRLVAWRHLPIPD